MFDNDSGFQNGEAKVAVVGDSESIMLFKALGMSVFYATQQNEVEKTLNALSRKGYSVIFITEAAANVAQEVVERYRNMTFPAIIPIPDKNGSTGVGMQRIRQNVEKAIGADILFGED